MSYNRPGIDPVVPRIKQLVLTALSLNSTNSDAGTFTGLPAKYRVTRVMVYEASASFAISLATVGLYTAAAAGGTAVVVPATITLLTAAGVFSDMTIAPTTYLTATSLFVRNAVAFGSAATISMLIEIVDLT